MVTKLSPPAPPGARQHTSVFSPSDRLVAIHVVDSNGYPIPGADISFTIDGIAAGGVHASTGRAKFHISNSSMTVGVSVVVGAQTQSTHLLPGNNTHTFQFFDAPVHLIEEQPMAICPNGSSGQPCVDCDIGGIIVRICVA